MLCDNLWVLVFKFLLLLVDDAHALKELGAKDLTSIRSFDEKLEIMTVVDTEVGDTPMIQSAQYPRHPHPRGYVALRASSTPTINGRLNDKCWQGAPWSEEFLDIQGPNKVAPWYSTRVKMLWDDEYLYIGAWMDEPQPWANQILHDSIIFKDNDFEIFIDPDGDNHNYYEIEINALGTVWDLLLVKPYRDGGPVLHNWETLASSEATQLHGPTGWKPMKRAVWVDGALNDGSVTSRGWGLEVALPWSILGQAAMRNSPPKDGDQWRINFSRVQWDVTWDKENKLYVKDPPDQSENNWVWSPQWEVNMHKPELWGYVQFSSHTATLEGDQDKLVGPPGSALKAGLDSHDDHAASAPVPEGAQAIPGSSSSSSRKWASVSSPSIPFVLDASWPIRTFLMEGYRLQKALFEKTGSYASSLDELGLPRLSPDQGCREVVQCTEVSFIVSAQMPTIKASGATSSSGLTSTDGQDDSCGDEAVVSISSSTVAVSNSSQNNSMNRNDVTRYYVNEQGHIFWRTVSTA